MPELLEHRHHIHQVIRDRTIQFDAQPEIELGYNP